MTPTEWLEANKEEFRDLSIELKKRKYPQAKAKDMLMGMAISICMERKGFYNKCIADEGSEDGDVQMMRTANVPECWARQRTTEAPPAPPSGPIVIPDRQVELMPSTLPPMSRDDFAQYNEDLSIITQPVRVIGDDEGGKKEARFASCYDYWQNLLHHNRPADVREVLLGVRVARCMYRTNYVVLQSRCSLGGPWQQAAGNRLSSYCYARF